MATASVLEATDCPPMAMASAELAVAPAVALPPMAVAPAPEAADLKPTAEEFTPEAADCAPSAEASAAVAFADSVASAPIAVAPAAEATVPTPIANASAPTLALAPLPIAMPEVAATTTDDCPPMAMASAEAA